MIVDETLRETVFNLLLTTNYKNILQYMKELGQQYQADISDQTDLKIKALLQHATSTTEYYAASGSPTQLVDLPVLTKAILKSDYLKFVSSKYPLRKLIPVKTSGSYGAPMLYHMDRIKKRRQLMELIYYNGWAKFRVGMKNALNISDNNRSCIKKYLQNESIYQFHQLQGQWLEELRTALKKGKVKFYTGFASALEAITEYCYNRNDTPADFQLLGIVAISEALNEAARERAEQVFGCPVIGRYATMELGVLAHECPDAKKYHLNRANYHIELLAIDSDRSIEEGEVGRVVVTDLHNYGLPLIRYDTGDLALLSSNECSCGRKGPIFERIEGRLVENIFDEQGKRWSGFAISYLLRDYTDIIRYRFIQKDKNEYHLLMITREGFNNEEELSKKIKEKLGHGIKLKFKYVKDIPPLKSGKRPYVINEYMLNNNDSF